MDGYSSFSYGYLKNPHLNPSDEIFPVFAVSGLALYPSCTSRHNCTYARSQSRTTQLLEADGSLWMLITYSTVRSDMIAENQAPLTMTNECSLCSQAKGTERCMGQGGDRGRGRKKI